VVQALQITGLFEYLPTFLVEQGQRRLDVFAPGRLPVVQKFLIVQADPAAQAG